MFKPLSMSFGKSEPRSNFKFYARDNRPSAIQGPIFRVETAKVIVDVLREARLEWLFESTRTGQPVGNVDNAMPEHRGRLRLTDETADVLGVDLVERNVHGFRRFVALYGGTESIVDLTEDEPLHEAVEAFAEGRPSPIRTLIIQFGDVASDVIYFAPTNTEIVDDMLPSLGIPTLSTLPKRNYREMKGEDLETAMTYLSCAEHDH
jgi:hypothetical protein